jgi:hypothetical protein
LKLLTWLSKTSSWFGKVIIGIIINYFLERVWQCDLVQNMGCDVIHHSTVLHMDSLPNLTKFGSGLSLAKPTTGVSWVQWSPIFGSDPIKDFKFRLFKRKGFPKMCGKLCQQSHQQFQTPKIFKLRLIWNATTNNVPLT